MSSYMVYSKSSVWLLSGMSSLLDRVLSSERCNIFAVLGYYATSNGSLTFRDKLPSSIFKGQSVQA